MKLPAPAALIAAAVFIAASVAPAQTTREYTDPDGLFAVKVPSDFKPQRNDLGIGTFTQFTSGGSGKGAKLEVFAIPSDEALEEGELQDTAKTLFGMVYQSLRQDGEVISEKTSATEFNGKSAVRSDMVFSNAEGRQSGYMLAVHGKRTAYLIAVSAPRADAADLVELESALATLAVESKDPLQGGGKSKLGAGKGMIPYDQAALNTLTTKFKGNLKRESRDKVLVPGDPALTYGSVAAFVELLSLCFEIEFTEQEFEMTRQRFIEYYKKQDAKGKEILAQGGQKMVEQLKQMPADERERQMADVRAVTKDRFENGAQAGIEYAVVLNDAIERRSKRLHNAAGKKPMFAQNNENFDSELSESDVDAATEMLYFMWVSSGRDPAKVTPQDLAHVRTMLTERFDELSPNQQYLFANSEQIYAGARTKWEEGDAEVHTEMNEQFNADLNSLGFTYETSGGAEYSESAWADWEGKDKGEFAAEMVQGLAGSSYKSAW